MPTAKKVGLDVSPWLPARGVVISRAELRRKLEQLQVVGDWEKRCWSLLRRRKAFFLLLGRGKEQEVVYVNSGGWCLEKHCHAARLVKAVRPLDLIL